MSSVKFTLKNLQDRAPQRKPGYIEAVLAIASKSGEEFSISNEDFDRIRRDFSLPVMIKRATPQIPKFGPGAELHKLLGKLGLKPKPGCKCNARINQMNLMGADWCSQNIDTIVGWLKEEATRSGLPFIEIAAKLMVKRAISRARKAKQRD